MNKSLVPLPLNTLAALIEFCPTTLHSGLRPYPSQVTIYKVSKRYDIIFTRSPCYRTNWRFTIKSVLFDILPIRNIDYHFRRGKNSV